MANIQVIFRDGSMQKTTDRVGSTAEQNYHSVGITHGPLSSASKYFFASKDAYKYWCMNARGKTEKDGHFHSIQGTYASSPQKKKKKKEIVVAEDKEEDDEDEL